jgi:hypothetical protein
MGNDIVGVDFDRGLVALHGFVGLPQTVENGPLVVERHSALRIELDGLLTKFESVLILF